MIARLALVLLAPRGSRPSVAQVDWPVLVASALFFLLPLSMTFRYAIHRFVPAGPLWSVVAYPDFWGLLAVVGVVLAGRGLGGTWRATRQDAGLVVPVSLAGLFLGWLVVSAVVQASDANFVARRLLMEWALPLCLAVALRAVWSSDLDAATRNALLAGTSVLMGVAVCTYLISFGIPASFHEHVFRNRTFLSWLGSRGRVYFGELTMGNVNVAAGHVATMACLAFGWAAGDSWSLRPRARAAWFALATLVLFLTFSRGALLFSFCICACFVAFDGAFRRSASGRVGVAATLILLAASLGLPGAWAYWRNQLALAPGSTAASRLSQWTTVSDARPPARAERPQGPEAPAGTRTRAHPGPTGRASRADQPAAHPREGLALTRGEGFSWIFGYGPGNYGIRRGLVRDSGTHNLFLNALVDGGIPGAIAFASLYASGLWRRLEAVRRAGRKETKGRSSELGRLAAYLSIGVVGVLVDYRLENLGTMTGACVFWLLLVAPPGSQTRELPGQVG